jgi:hypothetical protein
MTALKVHRDIRSFKKYAHLSFCKAAKKINLNGIQTDLSVTPYFIF